MADLGSVGTFHGTTNSVSTMLRAIILGTVPMCIGSQDTTEGTPTQPSLRIDAGGVWKFRWAVLNGARTISISAKQVVNESPRPTLVVKANPLIGVNADVTETAVAGAGWVTIGPATINPTSDGAVEVELRNNLTGYYQSQPCFFDTETITTT